MAAPDIVYVRSALISAWSAEVDDRLDINTADRLVALDWTTGNIRRLAALAHHVRRTGSAFVTMTSMTGPTPLPYALLDLTLITVGMIERGTPEAVAFGWIEVYACCPDQEALDDLVGAGSQYQGPNALPVLEWSKALGDLAPLAWAAGLPLDEAANRKAAGTLVPADLKMLAVLRGYQFPPLT